MTSLREADSVPEAKNEALPDDLVGGTGFYISAMASAYAELDESPDDIALGAPNYVHLAEETLLKEPAFNLREARAEIERRENGLTVTVAGKKFNGNSAYQQFVVNPGKVSFLESEVQGSALATTGGIVTKDGGVSFQLLEQWNIND